MAHPNHDDRSGIRSTIIATIVVGIIVLLALYFFTRGIEKEKGPDSTSVPFLFL